MPRCGATWAHEPGWSGADKASVPWEQRTVEMRVSDGSSSSVWLGPFRCFVFIWDGYKWSMEVGWAEALFPLQCQLSDLIWQNMWKQPMNKSEPEPQPKLNSSELQEVLYILTYSTSHPFWKVQKDCRGWTSQPLTSIMWVFVSRHFWNAGHLLTEGSAPKNDITLLTLDHGGWVEVCHHGIIRSTVLDKS